MNEQIIQAQTAVTSPDIAYPAKSRNYSIVSPFIDFLLVGGVSVFIIPFVMLPFWEPAEHSLWLGFTAYCLIFVLNLPHFIHSYQLLYRGYFTKMGSSAYGRGTKIRMAISGVIAPAVLIVFLLFGASQPDSRMLGYGTNVMLFTLGWHYVKQGYGIMMALSVRKKVFFDKMEKHILLANAYIVWLYSWFSLNTNANTEVYYGVPFTGAGLPVSWREPVLILFLLWTVIAVTILIRKSDRHPVLCYNGLAAYFFAVYPWVLFAFAHPNIIIFIPALHSLQYILFVWKLVYERTKEELLNAGHAVQKVTRKLVFKKMLAFLVIGFGAGALLFIAFPLWLDQIVPYNKEIFGPSLFVYCFLIFLNIHHYFIDFALWRRDNPEMKYLHR